MKRVALILVVALLMAPSVQGQTGYATAEPIQIQVTVNGIPTAGPTITVTATDTISVTCQIGYSASITSGELWNRALAQSSLDAPWDLWDVPGGEEDLNDDGTEASISGSVTLQSTGTMQIIPGSGGEERLPGTYYVQVNSNVYAEWSTTGIPPWNIADSDYAGYTLTVVLDDTPPQDTTPPVVTCPDNYVHVVYVNVGETAAENVDLDQLVIDGVVTATDEVGGSGVATINFDPPSASTFQLGDTVVTVTATDNAGNTTLPEDACTLTVRVEDPSLAIGSLSVAVFDLNLHHGIENSLDSKLDSALNALDDLNENNDVAAINSLEAFISHTQAQSGKKMPEDDANMLIAMAQNIIDHILGLG